MLQVEVIYISQDQRIFHKKLTCPVESTVREVIILSGLYNRHPETKEFAVGIFSKPANLDDPVKQGDRIEVYRPLLIDPKESRRQRAKKKTSVGLSR
ncbi:protein yfjF (plasmid) [Legionella adelaidensis]|uniref:UPF0125 protein Lade_1434 n=1 Tax=Legionella adelaidensis TaxID=45056 RepID=A0A0W0R2B8_9GAMM|nr:RnfH family protein [Legionella adelaidensis]KTC65251.1 Persistence and stress-resistance antitoxin PasI [Legionella adelaidensis]VEH86222.1 protein yfjF [Legionella adelaidensis]